MADKVYTLDLTLEELRLIRNALGHSIESIPVWEIFAKKPPISDNLVILRDYIIGKIEENDG